MHIPIFLVSAVAIALYINFRLRRANKNYGLEFGVMFERERAANSTRKKEIPKNLFYKPELNAVFLERDENITPEMKDLRRETRKLAEQKMIRFAEPKSNTDVKLEFGVTNLDFIINCEESFEAFSRRLFDYAKLAREADLQAEAERALLELISAGAGESRVFTLLADMYAENRNVAALEFLYEKARNLREDTLKHKIMLKINKRCNELFDE